MPSSFGLSERANGSSKSPQPAAQPTSPAGNSPYGIVGTTLNTLPVYERETSTVLTYAPDIDVAVPEVHYHQVIDHVPVVQEQVVTEHVEVRHVTQKEVPVLQESWDVKEIVRDVPMTVVREKLETKLVPQVRTEVNEVDIPIAISPQRYELVTPKVVYSSNSKRFMAKQEHVELPDGIVEVPCVVEVPQVEFVETNEVEEKQVPIDVVHKLFKEKPVEVAVEKRVEKIIEVPVVTTEVTTVQRPVLVPSADRELVGDGFRLARQVDATFHKELDDVKAKVERLEKERAELSQMLRACVEEGNDLQKEYMQYEREKATLQIQLKTTDKIFSPANVLQTRVVSNATSPPDDPMYPDLSFNDIDTNKDGVITREEFRSATAIGTLKRFPTTTYTVGSDEGAVRSNATNEGY